MRELKKIGNFACYLVFTIFLLVIGCNSESRNEASGWLGVTGLPQQGYSIGIIPIDGRIQPEQDVRVAVFVNHNNKPADGKTVALVSSRNVAFGENSGVTKNGWYFTSYTPTANQLGTDTITAMTGDLATSTVVYIGNPAPASLTIDLVIQPTTLYPGQKATLTIRMKDSEGFPANGTVAFASSLAGLFSSTTRTITNGFDQVTFTAGHEVGTATINLRSGENAVSKEILIKLPATVLKFKNYPLTMKTNEKTILSLQLSDDLGAPLAGQEVYWILNPADCGTITKVARKIDEYNTSTTSDQLGYVYVEFEASSTPAKAYISALLRDQIATISVEIK